MEKQHIILLSSKSAGSSALQAYLTGKYEIDALGSTRHQENETLFWTKAASILGLPQERMHRSVVPYPIREAKKQLEHLMDDNGISFSFKNWSEEELFEAYYLLAQTTPGAFFEKSPHHLRNESNLDLIVRAAEFLKGRMNLSYIGLIRHPLDTIYSTWSRWRYHCPAFEEEWYQSYRNLRHFTSTNQPKTLVLRYEDLTADTTLLDQFIKDLGIPPRKASHSFGFHGKSNRKWERDSGFGYQLKQETRKLAGSFGYHDDELGNPHYAPLWPLRSNFYLFRHKSKSLIRSVLPQ